MSVKFVSNKFLNYVTAKERKLKPTTNSLFYLVGYCTVMWIICLSNIVVSYQQRCCVARQVAGLRFRPFWGWSQAPQLWRCWSPAAGCWLPESTLSTGSRCPVSTPWGGWTLRGLRLESPRRSGHCCRCWWQTGWSSDLKKKGEMKCITQRSS